MTGFDSFIRVYWQKGDSAFLPYLCENLSTRRNLPMNLSFLTRQQAENYKAEMNLLDDESEIFDMLVKSYSIVKIADALKMSTRTVDRRIKTIKKKMKSIEA